MVIILFFCPDYRGGAFAEWDFLRGQDEGWIPKIPAPKTSSKDLYGSCYDIVVRTSDDESIIHEFPDPKSIDLSNWQGFSIDDDVVVSHGQTLELDVSGHWYDPLKSGDEHGLMYGAISLALLLSVLGLIRMFIRMTRRVMSGYTMIKK